MARVYRSLDEFRVVLEQLEKRFDPVMADSMRRGGQRIERSLIGAASKAAPSGRVLHRVGAATGEGTRRGSYLGYNVERKTRFSFLYSKTGQWQLRDSSVSSGPVREHYIGPRPDANPRPIREGGRYQPSLKNRAGNFTQGRWKVPASARQPYWANAIQSVQPPIVNLVGRDFSRLILEA